MTIISSTRVFVPRLKKRPHRFLVVVLSASMFFTSMAWAGADVDTAATTPPPGSYSITAEDSVIRFPFEIYRGDIRFRAEINGRDVYLLLDDGFMWDALLFWGSPPVDSLGLKYDGEVTVGDENDENALASRTASGITVGLPGVEFTDQTAVVTPYSSGNSMMWFGSIGQVSATFFKHFVVDINFDDMTITLTKPEKFDYQGSGIEIPWKPLGFGPWSIPAALDCADGRRVSVDLMMDLGYNDQLQIATGGEHDFSVPDPALPGNLGYNIQGVGTRGFYGRIPVVNIGGYEIMDVLASFVAEEHRDHTFHEVMIGLGLLSRFNLVFDYSRQRMFVEPNHTFREPYEFDMSGLIMRPGRGDYLEVVQVYPDSPAERARLQVGDKVTRIDNRLVAEYDTWSLRSLMRQEGKTVSLVVRRGDRERNVSIVLRRLI